MTVRKEETGDELLTDSVSTGLDEIIGGENETVIVEGADAEKVIETAEIKDPDGEGDDLTDEQLAALPKPEQAHYKGMKAERVKRQDAVDKLDLANKTNAELTEQVKQLIQSVNPGKKVEEPTKEEVKTFFDDPEGFIKAQLEGVTSMVADSQQAQQTSMLNMSEMLARNAHDDYDDKYALFETAARQNPAIISQILATGNPAEAAYQYGAQLGTMSQISEAGGLDALKEQIKAELIAGGQLTPEAETAETAITAALPTPLANKRSVVVSDQVGDDNSLDDILAG